MVSAGAVIGPPKMLYRLYTTRRKETDLVIDLAVL